MLTTHFIKQAHLKENPFRVPHGYFDLLSQQTGERISQISPRNHFPFRNQLALAASFILMVGLGYGVVKWITPKFDDTDISYTEQYSPFKTYVLLQDEELDEPLDSEQIITFLTEHGISPNTIAFLD